MSRNLQRLLGLLRAEDFSDRHDGELGGALAAPFPGAVLEERFEVRAILGQGGMGVVVQAYDRALGRDVALKFLSGEPTRARLARLRREATLAARIDSPHVVPVHSLETLTGRVCLVSAFVPGARPLHEAWGRSLEQRLVLLEQAALGVAAAHAARVIHRDLKPENVLVGADGRAQVTDFGVARAHDLDRLTETGALVGTLTYMAPEQATGGEISERTDVWALGVLLFQALHDRHPFTQHQTVADLLAALPKPVTLDPGLPPAVAALCRRALDPNPARRPADAAAFVAALREATTHSPATAPAGRLALAAALGLVVAVIGWGGTPAPRPPSPTPVVPSKESPARSVHTIRPAARVRKESPAPLPARSVHTIRPAARVRFVGLVGDELALELDPPTVERWTLGGTRLARHPEQQLTIRNHARSTPPPRLESPAPMGWDPAGRLGARLEAKRLVVFDADGVEQRSFPCPPLVPTFFEQVVLTREHLVMARSGSNGCGVRVWSRKDWSEVELEGSGETWITTRSLAASHDGSRLAIGGRSGQVLVWRLDQPGPPLLMSSADTEGSLSSLSAVAHSANVSALAFRDDRYLLSSAPEVDEVALWDTDRGARVDRRQISSAGFAIQPARARAAFALDSPYRVLVVPWPDPSRLPRW